MRPRGSSTTSTGAGIASRSAFSHLVWPRCQQQNCRISPCGLHTGAAGIIDTVPTHLSVALKQSDLVCQPIRSVHNAGLGLICCFAVQQLGFIMVSVLFWVSAGKYNWLIEKNNIGVFQFIYFFSSFWGQFGPNCTTFLLAGAQLSSALTNMNSSSRPGMRRSSAGCRPCASVSCAGGKVARRAGYALTKHLVCA